MTTTPLDDDQSARLASSASSIRIAEPAKATLATTAPTTAAPVNNGPTSSNIVIASAEPRPFQPPKHLIEITDLPTSGGSAPASAPHRLRGFRRVVGAEGTSRADAVNPAGPARQPVAGASWTTPAQPVGTGVRPIEHTPTTTAGITPDITPDRDKYSHRSDYAALRGRLEYSKTRQQWKLRYIPHNALDGEIDRHGGSVVLDNTPLLNACRAGDFVAVEGSLGEKDPNAVGFAPLYRLARVTRLE